MYQQGGVGVAVEVRMDHVAEVVAGEEQTLLRVEPVVGAGSQTALGFGGLVLRSLVVNVEGEAIAVVLEVRGSVVQAVEVVGVGELVADAGFLGAEELVPIPSWKKYDHVQRGLLQTQGGGGGGKGKAPLEGRQNVEIGLRPSFLPPTLGPCFLPCQINSAQRREHVVSNQAIQSALPQTSNGAKRTRSKKHQRFQLSCSKRANV